MPELFAAQVSIAPTRRRRFLWAAWLSGPPTLEPFRKPDMFEGGSRTREEALSNAETQSGVALLEIEPRWARAWGRIMVGDAPWPRKTQASAGARHDTSSARTERPVGASVWEVLGVSRDASLEEIKLAFRRRALEVHPDHGGSAAAFMQLQRAYAEAQKRASKPRPIGKRVR